MEPGRAAFIIRLLAHWVHRRQVDIGLRLDIDRAQSLTNERWPLVIRLGSWFIPGVTLARWLRN
jgi:hypothetical protein